jgi:hypothetical protein
VPGFHPVHSPGKLETWKPGNLMSLMGLLPAGSLVFTQFTLLEFPLVSPIKATAERHVSLPPIIWAICSGSVSGRTGLSPELAVP